MSPQYGELRLINGCDRLASLGHRSKFQRISRLRFVTAATSLTEGQPNLARCLAVSLADTLYLWGLLPLMEFCQVQNSLCIQFLRPPILAALLQGTRAASISQHLRHATRNGITELSQRAPCTPIFGWAAITLGIGPHSGFV